MRLKLSVFFMILISSFALAQENKTITGQILDPESLPLPGAEVKVIGKDIFAVTDFEGQFTLEGVTAGDVLRITYLGFETAEVPIGADNEYTIVLQPSTASLAEVVVVGYGQTRKQDLTGAISSVSAAEIVEQPASTAMEALQGKVAGVNIIKSDAPGASPIVTIRGLGTALGGREPLYVVDGVPVNGIANIPPSSIESIDVLKDASSAAIYGVRAANGVILITTKRGEEGKPVFRLRSYFGVKDILNPVEMANARQYVTYFNEENAAIDGDQLSLNQPYNTDWYEEILEIGFVNNHIFSVSGGTDQVNYYFSYDYFEEEGLLEGQDYRRSTITSNNTFDLFDDRLKIIQTFNLAITDETPKPFGAFNTAYRQSPLMPVFYPNGRYGVPYYNRTTGIATYIAGEGESIGQLTSHGNPVAAIDFSNQESESFVLQGSITAELKITDDLKFSSRYGARKFFSQFRSFNPNKARWLASDPNRTAEEFENLKAQNPESLVYSNNSLSFTNVETYKYNWDNFINWNKEFERHDLDVTLGLSREQIGIGSFNYALAYDVPESEQYWSIKHASDAYEKQVNQYFYTPTNFMSYFGRIQYDFDDKYYFTGTLRRDGSSNFRSNEEYFGTFPAVGLAWTVTNESFFDDSEVFNFVKIRGSWGKLGNASVPFNRTQILTDPNSGSMNYVFGPGQQLVYGAYIGSPAQNISWEVISEWSAGIDYELFDYKLSGSLDYYYRTTENTILQVQPLLNSTFSTDFYDHGAEVVNTGIEFAANWQDNITEELSYNIGTNFSYNHNEVTSVEKNYEGQTGGSLGNGEITKRLAEGEPLGSWWMYEVAGVWQTEQEIENNAALGGARPGHLRYVDQNMDGVIDDRDKIYLGSYIPKYNYGVSVGLNYNQFDFSVDGYGSGGNKVYNALKNTRIGGENIPVEVFNNRWTGPGSTNLHPGADRDARASSYYLEDGDFFRINNITLGYTLPELGDFVSNARIYISAQNPFIFTDYSGFTPELPSNGNPYGTTGIELSAYPNTKTFLIGLNVEL